MCHIISILLLLYSAYTGHVQSLSKVNIGLKPYEFHQVDNAQTWPSEQDNTLLAYNLENVEPVETKLPIKPVKSKKTKKMRRKKKKKLIKTKKPKKMKLRRVFKTRIITTTLPSLKIETVEDFGTTNVINLAPIYDTESGMSYQPEELDKICAETVQISRNFGIVDIEGFAKNNCFLIRMYYTNVTCSQINQLVKYCIANGLMNG